jgi:GMP synthase (glutamine-hydrolysing)
MRVAIIENTLVTHHGQVGVALHEAGAMIDQYKPYARLPLPRSPSGYDALVVFGGEQFARDDATHPYLPDLADLMRRFHAADLPVLGICLGAQVLARAFGAANHLGTAPEFGWCDVTRTAAGAADPVLAALPDRFPIFQWHSDTFDLPEEATLLATAPGAAHQAYRLGRATYGTQFHFEASRAVVADWTRSFPEAAERMEPGWVAAHAARAALLGGQADTVGLAIARAWVGLIG